MHARAFASGYNPSFSSTALYNVIAGVPTVEFASASDTVPASGAAAVSTYYPVFALSAVPNETVRVTYTVLTPGGSLTESSTSFLPGERYKQFPVSLSGRGTWRIAIVAATGAIPVATTVFHLTRR